MQIDQRKYYLRGVVLPAAIVVLIQFGVYLVHENQTAPGYESEYFTQSGLNGAGFTLVLVNTFFVLMLCSPILLFNLAAKSKIFLLLSWFLLPGIWLLYLMWNAAASMINDHTDEAFYALVNSLPYAGGLIWSYSGFRKQSAINEGELLPEMDVITKEDRKINQSHTPPPQSPMG